jgi:hypothetical protein
MITRDGVRQIANLIAAVATIIFNLLATALPLNGQTTGEISDRFQVYFVPAGYVFSIWGLIYIGWLAFAIYQLLPSQRHNPRLQRIGYLFVWSGVANMAWLWLWHYEFFVLTVGVMLALLLLLIAIYARLRIGQVEVSALERWCVDIPFSVYLGWISVATIANITATLDYLQWDGWGLSPEAWTLVMLAVGVALAAVLGLTRGDIAYLLVIVWAFAGIAVKHSDVPVVATGAWAATALVAVLAVVSALRAREPKPLSRAAS